MQMTVTGVRQERVDDVLSMLGERRLALLMNAYKYDEYTVEVQEYGVLYVVGTVHVQSRRGVWTYRVSSHGLTIANLVPRCDCPESVFGAKHGYRLFVACKHALLLHAFKSSRAAQEVCTLLNLLYPYQEVDADENHRH